MDFMDLLNIDPTEEAITAVLGIASTAVLGPAGPALVKALSTGRKTYKQIEQIKSIAETVSNAVDADDIGAKIAEQWPGRKNMSEERGIKETKEVLYFIFSFSKAFQESMADGDFDWYDAKNFVEPLRALGDAIDDIYDVIPEVQDLSAEEMQELSEYIKENFDIEDDDLEASIEKAIDTGVELMKLFQTLKFNV